LNVSKYTIVTTQQIENTATLGSLIVQSIQFPVQNIIPLLTIITLLASTQFIALGMKKAVGRS